MFLYKFWIFCEFLSILSNFVFFNFINVEKERLDTASILRENIDKCLLRITEFYCVYHEYNFTEGAIEYFEFVEEEGKLFFAKSIFRNLLEKLMIRCMEIQQKNDEDFKFISNPISNISNQLTYEINLMIYNNEKENCKAWLMNSIYTEIK